MVSKELWREKCSGRKDVLSAWLLVAFAVTAMNIVLSLTTRGFCTGEGSLAPAPSSAVMRSTSTSVPAPLEPAPRGEAMGTRSLR